jgi:hypothetical protein
MQQYYQKEMQELPRQATIACRAMSSARRVLQLCRFSVLISSQNADATGQAAYEAMSTRYP